MNNYILQEKRRKQRKDERTLARIAKYRRSKRAGAIVLAALTAGIWGFCFYALDKQIQPDPSDAEETVSNVAESESNVTNSATRGELAENRPNGVVYTASGEVAVEEADSSPEMIGWVDAGEYTITAYCGCEKCCGKWASNPVIGSGNITLVQGMHCASPLPLGTIVDIEGVGIYEVQDTTSEWVADKYNDKIIDIYFLDHSSALQFGKRVANVKIMEEI